MLKKTRLEPIRDKKKLDNTIEAVSTLSHSMNNLEEALLMAVQEVTENEIEKQSLHHHQKTSSDTGKKDLLLDSFQPANDDQKINIEFKQHVSGFKLYWFLSTLTLAWVFGVYFTFMKEQGISSLGGILPFLIQNPQILLFILLPVSLVWFFTIMFERSQANYGAIKIILNNALQLMDQEKFPRNHIGHSTNEMQKEIHSLNEFLTLALSRSSEIRETIQAEINALTDASIENQNRLSTLIEDLKTERESVINHASNIRESVMHAQDNLREDIDRSTIFLKEEFEKHLQDVENIFFLRGQSLIGEFEIRIDTIEKTKERIKTDIDQAIEKRLAILQESLQDHIFHISSSLNKETEKFNSLMMMIREKMNEEREKNASVFSVMLADHITHFSDHLDTKRNEFSKVLLNDYENIYQEREEFRSKISDQIQLLRDEKDHFAENIHIEIEHLAAERTNFETTATDYMSEMKQTRLNTLNIIGHNLEEINKARMMMEQTIDSALEKLSEKRVNFSEHLKNDLEEIDTNEALFLENVQTIFMNQSLKISEERKSIKDTLETEFKKLIDLRIIIDQMVTNHVKKLSETREVTAKEIEHDLHKFDVARESIDQKIQENREMLLHIGVENLESLQKNSETIKNIFEQYNSSFTHHTNLIETIFKEKTEHLNIELEHITEKTTHSLHDKIFNLAVKFSEKTDEKINDITDKNTIVLMQCVADLTKNFTIMNETLETSADKTVKNIEQTNHLLMTQMEKIHSSFEETQDNIIIQTAQVFETLTTRSSEVTNVVKENTENILASCQHADEELKKHGEKTLESINLHTDKIIEIFDKNDEKIKAKALENAKLLAQHAVDIVKCFNDSEKNISHRLKESTEILHQKTENIFESIEMLTNNISDKVTQTCGHIDTQKEKFMDDFAKADVQFEERTNHFSSLMEEKLIMITSTLEQTNHRLKQHSEEATIQFATQGREIYEILANSEKKLVDTAIATSSRVVENFSDAQKKLITIADEIAEKIENQIQYNSASLSENTNIVVDQLKNLKQEISETTNEAQEIIQKNTVHFSHILNQRSNEINRLFNQGFLPFFEKITTEGSQFEKIIETATEKATATLHNESMSLLEKLENQKNYTVDAITSVQNSLSQSVDHLVERFDISGARIFDIVKNAEEKFENVDQRITGTSLTFSDSTERALKVFESSTKLLDSNTNRLNQMTSEAFNKIVGIANQFEEYAKTLNNANELLSVTQGNLNIGLDERQKLLESLLFSLMKKSGDIENMMQSFERLIEGSLEKVDHHTKVSTENINNSVHNVMESATQRFSSATQEMEKNLENIRLEFKKTNVEFEKDLKDIPSIAHEATSFIRQSIAEQVHALQELTLIAAQCAASNHQPQAPLHEPKEHINNKKSEEKTPLAKQEPIASLNSDIIHAIDEKLFHVFWDNIETGKNKMNLNDLYTLEGKKIFENIKARYISDINFKKTVESYCNDFEKLIHGVSRTAKGQEILRAYRLSDKGKIYLILAHASGKI